MKESDIKYLAGLIDADGWIGLKFQKCSNLSTIGVKLGLSASVSIDRGSKFLNSLPELTGCGSTYLEKMPNENHADRNHWTVGARGELERLLPRIAKHSIIKANLIQGCLQILRSTKGIRYTDEQVKAFKELCERLRKQTGPIKSKNFLSWAYTAGYLDGDGCYSNRKHQGSWHRNVSTVCHPDDKVIRDYLLKCYGGTIWTDQAGNLRWSHSLGLQNYQFADKFLSQMSRYSKLKKHKIDMILHGNRQRLSEKRATAQAIV